MAKIVVACFVAVFLSNFNVMFHNLAELVKFFLFASVIALLER